MQNSDLPAPQSHEPLLLILKINLSVSVCLSVLHGNRTNGIHTYPICSVLWRILNNLPLISIFDRSKHDHPRLFPETVLSFPSYSYWQLLTPMNSTVCFPSTQCIQSELLKQRFSMILQGTDVAPTGPTCFEPKTNNCSHFIIWRKINDQNLSF